MVQSTPPAPVPVLGGVTTGCCPPAGGGGGGGGGADDVGSPGAGVFVGPGVGVLVCALLVGVDVGHLPFVQGVFVIVGVGGTEVFVAVGICPPPVFVSAAPKHLVALVGQQVRKIRVPESTISTYASERLSVPVTPVAVKVTRARGADTPFPTGSVGSSVEFWQSMRALPRSAGSPVRSTSHRG